MKDAALPLSRKLLEIGNKRKSVTIHNYSSEEKAWDKLMLETNRTPHYIQSSAWGESKTRSQWPVSRLIAYTENGILPIQVFSRTVPGLGTLHYSPEVSGITADNIPTLTKQLYSQYGKGLAFKLELYQPYSERLVKAFENSGWVQGRSVQHRNTIIVDLKGTEEDLIGRLRKRARYEVRVAQRNNVRIEKVSVTPERLGLLATLMNITAKRSGAFFRKSAYTNRYWQSFANTNQASLYFAYHDMDLLAGAFVITYGNGAWYKDGGSVRQKSNLMGPRFLQWEIMRDLQSQNIEFYDLCGIPNLEDLEKSSMKGLYVFKTGFTNETTRFMPTMELPFGKRYPIWQKTENDFLRLYSGFTKDFWY